MRRADALRFLRRADHRAVLLTAGLLLAAIAVQAGLVFAFVAIEELEDADHWVAYVLKEHRAAGDAEGVTSSTLEAQQSLFEYPLAWRVLDADGRVLDAQGSWPLPERLSPAAGDEEGRGLREFRDLQPDRSLSGGLALAHGGRLEIALPLAPFYEEAREVGLALGMLAGISGIAALLLSGVAMSWAFAPLRRATRLVEGIDARALGQRLPSQGTGDPVDRHAEALNRVLADVDATFERLRAFSADVAHELRTPLNRLQNVAEVALLEGGSGASKDALEWVHAAAVELSRTLQSLLLLAELDERRVDPHPAAVDLDAWLARFHEIYEPLFEEAGASLACRGHAGALPADLQLLDRVLGNLLDNALLHGAAGGRVEIRARRDELGVTFEIDDAGTGIPGEMAERVFDRFTRLDRARSGPGAGLGLAVARACARVAGGTLRVGRSQLGGACFEWTLPVPVERASDG